MATATLNEITSNVVSGPDWLSIVAFHMPVIAAEKHWTGKKDYSAWLTGSRNKQIAAKVEATVSGYEPEAIESVLRNDSAIRGQIRMAICNLDPDEVLRFQQAHQQQHQCSTHETRGQAWQMMNR